MQSVEISGLKEIQKRLEGYPEAMKKARSEFFEEAGREMLSTVRRRIGGQGYVANVQDQYVGSGGAVLLSVIVKSGASVPTGSKSSDVCALPTTAVMGERFRKKAAFRG